MELRELFYFKTIVEETSILKAANKLHVSQPPLSRMVKKLEDELGTILFIRGKKLTLTPSGKLLYDKALSILALNKDIISEIAALENGYDATILLGIVSSSTSLLYTKAIQIFKEKYPHIRFNIKEANTYQLIDLLKKHVIDLAIVRTPFDNNDFDSFFFTKEKMILLSKEVMNLSITKLKYLDNKPIIIYRRFKEIIEHLFQKYKLHLNIICEVDDAKTAILFASTGIGYALVPESAYNLFSYLGLSKAFLDEEGLETSLGVISRKNEELIPAYQAFINVLKETQESPNNR